MGGIGGRASADWPGGVTGAGVGGADGNGGPGGTAVVTGAADEGTSAAGGALVTATGLRRREARRVGAATLRFAAAATRPAAAPPASERAVARLRGAVRVCCSGSEAAFEGAGGTFARGACLGEAVVADLTEAVALDSGFRPVGPAPDAAGTVGEMAGRVEAGSGDFGARVTAAGRRAAGGRGASGVASVAAGRTPGDFFRAGTCGAVGGGAGAAGA
jgi:hypothetical protein